MYIIYVSVGVVHFLIPVLAVKSSLRIIRGRDANLQEYPYVVQIEQHQKLILFLNNKTQTLNYIDPQCTGAALTKTWMLTAGHCVRHQLIYKEETELYVDERKRMIRYGFPKGIASEDDTFSAVLDAVIISMVERSDHKAQIFDDIGLLKTEPVLIKEYAKISAIDYASLRGHEVTLVGFGLMQESSKKLNTPFELRKPLQVLDKGMLTTCGDIKTYPAICVVSKCGETKLPCFGDSGAPVFHRSGVIGVISNGEACMSWDQMGMSRPKEIVALTPVSPYVDWLSNIITSK